MDSLELLRSWATFAYQELCTAVEGVTEQQSWAMIGQASEEYLHTDGSIQGIVLHIASCKFMYGSIAFRNSEVKWRDCASRMDDFEPNWQAARDYLDESHHYWMESWNDLTADQLNAEVRHFSGKLWPTHEIIRMVTHHDSYHAGQIAVIRHATNGSVNPPPSYAEDIRKYCGDLPDW